MESAGIRGPILLPETETRRHFQCVAGDQAPSHRDEAPILRRYGSGQRDPESQLGRGLEATSWGGVFPVSEDQVQVQPFVLVQVVVLTRDLRVVTAFSSPEVAQSL